MNLCIFNGKWPHLLENSEKTLPDGVRSSDLLSFKERLFPRLANIPLEKPMPIDKLSDSSPESVCQEGYGGQQGWGAVREF